MFRIEIPTPFEVGRVNCYAWGDRQLAILDPGPATEEAYEALSRGLDERGHAIDDIAHVLITHPHMDHFGIANRISTDVGATVHAHTDAVARLQDPQAHFEREQAFFVPFLESMGVPRSMVDTVVGLPEPYTEFREAVTVDDALGDGDVLDAGVELWALHTPGHAPGSICFCSAERGIAFTGDHVMQEISPNPVLTVDPGDPERRTRSLPQYLESLRRLRATGLETGRAGHRGPIDDLPGRIDEILAHHDERKERIAGLLDEDGPMTAFETMQELFPDLPAREVFSGMSEVIGHVDLLEDEGRVETTETGGVVTVALRSA